ncbi:uncharacterized protein LOC127239937 [Andrographis paniculata]|uniref:uncharacterized protein LOC127239937 n=1 Tax=Andrographis paniculata TaxID=175694 RepID=UPI0021E87054|nr:uncharacterized protein LOC127239937 [Andrographis paniculata]
MQLPHFDYFIRAYLKSYKFFCFLWIHPSYGKNDLSSALRRIPAANSSRIELSTIDTVVVFNSDLDPMNDLSILQKIKLDSKFKPVKIFGLYFSKDYGKTVSSIIRVIHAVRELNSKESLRCPIKIDFLRERGSLNSYESGKDTNSSQKVRTIYIRGFYKRDGIDQIKRSLEQHFGLCGEMTRITVPKQKSSHPNEDDIIGIRNAKINNSLESINIFKVTTKIFGPCVTFIHC